MTRRRRVTETVEPEGREFEPFIDRREVGRRLRVGARRITEWMRRGLLPYYQVDHAIRFKWSEVEEHLSRFCRVSPPTDPSNREPKEGM